ncbi:MAG: nitroreductase [Microthrixaceae bacterium]|jgi:nitroreductase|nr:nitroreductase [Microthrixaceae bacterium]
MAQIPVPDDLLPDHPASESVPDVIRNRRTSLVVDPARPVDPEVVRGLIELATWAPNHKRTWPWRFTVLTGESRSHLGEAFAAVGESLDMDPMKVSSQRTKYLRSPVVVLVWVIGDPDPVRRREDRDATAAAVQNLLLAATSEGLASYWASISDHFHAPARALAGLDDNHDFVALIYLGHPIGQVAAPPRPDPEITWLGQP